MAARRTAALSWWRTAGNRARCHSVACRPTLQFGVLLSFSPLSLDRSHRLARLAVGSARAALLLLLATAPLLFGQKQNLKKNMSGFIGSEVCKGCHADVWSTFYKNP